MSFLLAGDEGFEPPMSGPEPGALPLGQSPTSELTAQSRFGYSPKASTYAYALPFKF